MNLVNWTTLAIASMALFVAVTNFRRGNTAVIKLVSVDFSHQSNIEKNGGRFYSEFSVLIKNLGIPLTIAHVTLTAHAKGLGIKIPFSRFQFDEIIAEGGSLEKGMVAKFGLRSFDLPQDKRNFLSLLDDEAIFVKIVISSNGYVVKSFRLDKSGLKLRRKWNDFAARMNMYFVTTTNRWGKKYTSFHNIVPIWSDPLLDLRRFIDTVSKEPIAPKVVQKPIFGPYDPSQPSIFGSKQAPPEPPKSQPTTQQDATPPPQEPQ
jgi:hypothetical protein